MHEQQKTLDEIDRLIAGSLGKAVLEIVTHPDDGSWMWGGTLSKLTRSLGLHADALLITDGDFDGPHVGRRRVFEQLAENEVLGVRRLRRARLPDGAFRPALVPYAVNWIHEQILRARAEGVEYGAILLPGPKGFSGHKDHKETNRAARRAIRGLANSGIFTGNVWEICMPPDERAQWPDDYFVPVPSADIRGCLEVDISGDPLTQKRNAILVNKSQRNNGGDAQSDRVGPREYWRRWNPFVGNTVLNGTVYSQNGNV
jgi:LmbE family N-acetylglucosaminyl deacetylase